MPSQDTPMPWQQLQGKIDPAIFSAPKTCGDPAQPGIWPMVHQKIVTYIVLSMTGKPWADHLALAAAVLIARHRDVRTVLTDRSETA